jgi:hypothetical protein
MFLLVWDKDWLYREIISIASMYMYIALHIGSSSLLPSTLPIVAYIILKFLYSFLYSEHINHIQVLGFPSFSQFLLWPFSP